MGHLSELGQVGVGLLFSFFKIMGHLSELGQVGVGLLFSILGHLLVLLQFVLKLLDELLHSGLVFAVFIGLEGEFFDTTIHLSVVLKSFSMSALFTIKITLKILHTSLHGSKSFSASFECICLGFFKFDCKFMDLLFQCLLDAFNGNKMLLFLTQLFRHTSSISNSLLGTLISTLRFSEGFIKFGSDLFVFSLELSAGA